MEANKILFISQEIAPYLNDSPTSLKCRDLPQGLQELGAEVRMFMPKYGYINERRNQLHEVIRLSGMNIIIDDTDHPLIIKVATLQPSRMQVYFIYNDDYFARGLTKELETASNPEENDERAIFYVRGVIESVRKLRWNPDIIQCNGWISALTPLYMRDIYANDASFRDAKIIYSLWNDDFQEPINSRMAEKMLQDGISKANIEHLLDKPVTHFDLTRLAIEHADAIAQCSPEISPEIEALAKESGKPFLPYQDPADDTKAFEQFYDMLMGK